MIPERHVKLFKNGRNQAVRIPREFELPGEDAIMRKEGDRLIIEATPPKSLLALLATLAPLVWGFCCQAPKSEAHGIIFCGPFVDRCR